MKHLLIIPLFNNHLSDNKLTLITKTELKKGVKYKLDLTKDRFDDYDINKLICFFKNQCKYSYDSSIPSYLLGDVKNAYQYLLDLLSNAVRFTTDSIVYLVIECLDAEEIIQVYEAFSPKRINNDKCDTE